MKAFKQAIAKSLCEYLSSKAQINENDVFSSLEYPPDKAMGDLALPCFKFSKIMRQSPVAIAIDIANNFSCQFVSSVKALNGYLNITLDSEKLARDTLSEVFDKGEKFGGSGIGEGKTAVFDYSSPNVAKPFHIGHLGSTVIGHSLKLIHEFSGYKCVGINYLGDWGTQFGKLITAYKMWGNGKDIEIGGVDFLSEIYVKFHEEVEKDESLLVTARGEFKKLEDGDPENIELWKKIIDCSLVEYEKTYKQLGITFDSYKGESFYTDKMPRQIEKMKEIGLLKIDSGASIVDLEEYNMPPCLILKSDGTTLYPTRDIAAAVYRYETYDFDKCVYVTSAGQSLHFAQWFKVVELMGYEFCDKLVHVPYGTISINGEKAASRTGNTLLLRDIFASAVEKAADIINEKNPNLKNKTETAEQVGIGAVVFHYLSGNRIHDISFSLEEALSFEGNTGPYAQYTYARTRSILSKSEQTTFDLPEKLPELSPEEREVVKCIARFPEKVEEALAEYQPSTIVRYILDLCAGFNRFYHNNQVLSAEAEKRAFRIALTAAVSRVLANAMRLVCVHTPEEI
jgi:arginyl-tRNA synthetase